MPVHIAKFVALFFIFLTLSVNSVNAQDQSNVLISVNEIDETVKNIIRVTNLAAVDDEALVGARVRLENLKNVLSDFEAVTNRQITDLTEKLEQFGPEPENIVSNEDVEISKQRSSLSAKRTAEILVVNRIDDIKTDIDERIHDISEKRRTAFLSSLYERNPLNSNLLVFAATEYSSVFEQFSKSIDSWLTNIFSNKLVETLVSTLLAIALALAFSVIFRIVFKDWFKRDQTETEPQFFSKISTGFWSVILPSLITSLFLGSTFILYQYFGVLTPDVSGVVASILIAIAGIVFVFNLANAVLYRKNRSWRLINLSDGTAFRLFWLVIAMAVIYALDYIATSISNETNAGLSFTIMRSLLTSIIMGLLLIMTGFSDLVFRSSRNDAEGVGLPRWLSFGIVSIGFAVIAIALSGYIGLGRFLVQQVVVTGAILATIYLGLTAGRQIGAEGIFVQSRLGRQLINRFGVPTQTIEQVGILVGLIFMACVLLAGVPLIFLQWGSASGDVLLWYGKLISGFKIGAVQFSLSGILVGIATLIVGLVITRMFQRWLGKSVLPRTKADSGVQDSIKAGAGYTGIAIAIIFAVTNAGLDLSSLAIVAGALSLGIGFGLQNIVSNFVSGLILLIERPIKVGDWIVLGTDTSGFVKKISVRATEIETFNKQTIIIPNSEIINGQVGNWTHKSKTGRIDIPVGVAYGSDMQVVETALLAAANSCTIPMQAPEPFVFFEGFGDSSVNLQLRVHLRDILQTPLATKEIAYAIVHQFNEYNIEIPFPQRDLNIKSSVPFVLDEKDRTKN